MFKNQYDTELIFSPDGKLFQVEYAMEAVKQGSCCVAMQNASMALVASVKRSSGEHPSMSVPMPKIFRIHPRCAMGISGLAADGRVLTKMMRTEALGWKHNWGEYPSVHHLVGKVAKKSQANTQKYGTRAYGVGLLVAGWDSEKNTPVIVQTCPSGSLYYVKAMAIGARSQSAKTYLEKNIDGIEKSNEEDLVRHAIKALRSVVSISFESQFAEKKEAKESNALSVTNVEIMIVSKDKPIVVLDNLNNTDQLARLIEEVESSEKQRLSLASSSTQESKSDKMEVDVSDVTVQ